MITQNQYNVLRQPARHLNIKIDLINENDIIVDSFEGIATDGSISMDGNSTYRRSGNMTMVFDKKYNILPSPESKVWFNKRIGIYVGLKNYFDEIIWFNMGRFAITDVDLNFNTAEKTMSCTLSDYMAFLDGNLGGTLSHQTVIPVDTPISEAIKSTLTGLDKVSVEDIKIDGVDLMLPYTIEKPSGSTVYELIKEMLDLYMGWDFYCNENGVYVVEKIRDKANDPVVEVFDGTNKDLTLNSQPKVDFKHTRNSVYIWGRQLDDGTQARWVYRNRWARNNKKDLDDLTDKQKGDICHITLEDSSYAYGGDGWSLLDFKVIPQFNIEQIGEKIYSDSNEKIFTEEQAKLKAEYELQQRSNMAETVSFSCVPLYYLQPLNKININIDNLIQGDYLITSVALSLNIEGNMTIDCQKLYY